MILSIKVTPKATRTEVQGRLNDGTLKIRIKAAPEHGKANEELLAFLAKSLKIQTSEIILVSGHSSSRKRIQIPDQLILPW